MRDRCNILPLSIMAANKLRAVEQERDALRAQIEVMRALLGECRDLTDPRQWPLRLHDKINSAMQDKP